MKNTYPRLRIPIGFLSLLLVLVGCNKEPMITTHSPEALRLYGEGVSKWQKFYYKEAEESLKRAVALDSSFAMAWGRLAMVYGSSDNEAQALEAIEKAVRYAPQTSRREQLYVSLWNHRLRYHFRDAARVVDSLIALYPDEAEAYFSRGLLYDLDKRYDDALRMYQKAIGTDSTFALAQMMLGYAYSNLGKNEEALEEMDRYVRLAPEAADPRASYADLLMRVGRYDEALEQYQKALELKPDYWYAVRQIGEVYLTKGQLKKGRAELYRSLELIPKNPQRVASYKAIDGSVAMARGNFSEAKSYYREALTADSLHWSAAFGIVRSLGELKQFAEAASALDHVRRVLEYRNLAGSTMMLDFYVARAILLTEQDSLEQATQYCDSALQYSAPLTRRAVYRAFAEIYRRQKNYEAALSACEEALRINPAYPPALLTLTRVYAESGDNVMTAEIAHRLLAIWKDADPDYRYLIEIRRLLRQSRPPQT